MRTLIVGGYGYDNLGDEAMLAGLLTQVDRSQVTVVSRDPSGTARLHGVASIEPRRAVRALADHGSVVIGGGGLFGRDMGRLGRLLPVFGELAARGGRQVRLRGVGFDRDVRGLARYFAARLCRVADEITVRDNESVEVLAEWGVAASVAPDLSALLAPASIGSARQILSAAGVTGSRSVVGLALTAVEPRLAVRILDAVPRLVEANPDVEFCFLPMSRHPSVTTHDDRVLAAQLRDRAPGIRVARVNEPGDALALVGCFDALIAMRYHALLFAERMGVPLVAVPYAEKCRHWLDERGLPSTAADFSSLQGALNHALAGERRRVAS